MQITWNQHVVKKNNKALVLQVIIEKAPLSRADIAQDTGLNKATVSSLVTELLAENLIYESGPGESSGGRRPVMLLFQQTAGYAIGIDLGVNYILGIVTDLRGNKIIEHHLSIRDLSIEHVMNLIKEMIQMLIAETPKSPYGVIGIGIGVPGIVDKAGNVLLAPNLGWKNVRMKQIVEGFFAYPIIIENEANAGAYGEKQFGAGKDVNNLIYVSAGTGIGVGIVINGALYRGANGYSGESGHMVIQADGKRCTCGMNGCWEAYASEHALIHEAQKSGAREATLELIIEQAKGDHQDTLLLFKQIGNYLGTGMSNLIKTFNPEQIIIGNRLSMAKEWLNDPINDTIKKQTQPFHLEHLQIDFAKQSTHSAAIGVSAFVIEAFLKGEQIEGEKGVD